MAQLRFCRDYGNPEVERLARACAIQYGCDPDSQVPETGYPDAALIPLWWRFQDAAMKYIAMRNADCAPSPLQREKP